MASLKAYLLSLLGVVLIHACATPPGPQPVEPSASYVRVMVLGSYHFGNPGLDLNNMDADDVTAPARQAELEALSRTLLAFEPTVVAHEGRAEAPYLDMNYAHFSPDDLRTERNEIVQIAYRVAYDGGVERVYAIDEQPADDEPNYFPFNAVRAFAERNDLEDALKEVSDFSYLMAEFKAAQTRETIPELLLRVNGDAFHDELYWNMLKFGKGEDQPGPELAAYWFMRNAKIFNKLDQNVAPGDRVLVVYGAGHGHWLRDMVRRTPGYALEPVHPYLERAAQSLR